MVFCLGCLNLASFQALGGTLIVFCNNRYGEIEKDELFSRCM